MPKDVIITGPVRVKNLSIRKVGLSFKISVPAFWVENQDLSPGDEVETYIDQSGSLILRPAEKKAVPV